MTTERQTGVNVCWNHDMIKSSGMDEANNATYLNPTMMKILAV